MSDTTIAPDGVPVTSSTVTHDPTISTTPPAVQGVPIVPGPTLVVPLVAPIKKTRRRSRRVPEAFWIELRLMYEGQDYSQRDLCNYTKMNGWNIGQSSIARRAVAEGWIKGSIKEEIKKQAIDDIRKRMGDQVADMLGQHDTQARALLSETLVHFRRAQQIRTDPTNPDPAYMIPVSQLQMIGQTLRTAQQLQSWANGWDHKRGRPFRDGDKQETDVPEELKITVLSPEEEETIRATKEDPEDK